MQSKSVTSSTVNNHPIKVGQNSTNILEMVGRDLLASWHDSENGI